MHSELDCQLPRVPCPMPDTQEKGDKCKDGEHHGKGDGEGVEDREGGVVG